MAENVSLKIWDAIRPLVRREIDANIANLEKQIEKYKERKRALISEVVTGKRRV